MKTKTALKLDPQTSYAAQNAREGLINVADLSILTGVDVGRLNKFAKTGSVVHYGEYHGKRFFNFEELVNWVNEPDDQNEAKPIIRETIQTTLQKKTCPYTLEKLDKSSNGAQRVRIVWKELVAE